MVEGVFAGSAVQSGTSFSTAASTCDVVSPPNTCRPVSISRSTTPNAQRSLRLSTALPAACSGDMYAAVPRMMPACVACIDSVGEFIAFALDPPAGSIAFAKPKSSTFTVPSGRTLMLAGFRSR